MFVTDALYSAALLGATAGLSLADGARARATGFPVHARDVTRRFLARALAERYPGIEVRDLEVLDHHSGTTSRARIRIDARAEGTGAKPPDTLFLKLTPHAVAQKLFVTATGIGRNELRFYRELRSRLPVRAPDVHGLASLPGDRHFVLILEDLAASGVRLSDLGIRATLEDAERVVDALAALHACFWEGGRIPSWVPRYETRRRSMAWERFMTGRMIGLCRRRYEAGLPAGFGEIGRICVDERDRLEALWARGPRTLLHGDCHLGNLFFEGRRVGFFDWQVCAYAPGMRDVSYFLCNSLPMELRRAHERTLIERYLAALDVEGTPPPPFEEAWRQHRLFALYAWIAAAFTTAAGSQLQPREIAEAGLQRATWACIELESVACARRDT